MELFIILISLLGSFALVMGVTPVFIRKLIERDVLTIDYYKRGEVKIPTRGGIIILAAVLLVFGIATLFEHLWTPSLLHVSRVDWALIIVAGLFGAFGLVDDFVDVGRPLKVIFLSFFSFRLIFDIHSTTVTLPFLGTFDLGLFYLFFIIPVYVLVVANLVNMHSGFNGLASGLSAILIATLLLKFIIAGYNGVFMLSSMLGAVLGFLWYNRYPSRIFLGNIGSLSIGAAIGSAIVVSGFLVSGFIMLIPHTINFLMYVYWRVMHKLHPEDERWKIVKFGKVREDGTLEVPNYLTLKWVFPYFFRMNEKQAVLVMYALTIPFCIVALFVPY